MSPGRPKDPNTAARRAAKRAEEKSLGLHRRVFTKADIARMFDCRADGMSNTQIGKRFGCDCSKITELIGPRVPR